ncbi:hypothetical protein BJ912DRAFT_922044 [Pholiota molesta]|nr:hypothetical protein BJ912DRAFT_922044 [Pholiota molesta]
MASTSNIESVWKTLSASRRPGDVQKLIEIACRNMEILEPWNHATSEHPDAMALIGRVQEVLASFVKALKRSKEVAKHGFKNVTKESKKVVSGFRDVRKELDSITNEVPGQVVNIQEEHKDEIKKLEVAVKNGERMKVAKVVGTTVVAIAGGVAAIAFAPALIFLPVALPIIHLITEMIDNRMSKAIEVRKVQTRNCEEALETLKKMTEDLVQLNMCIDEFSAFWTNVEMLLGVVTGRIKELRNTQALDLRLKTVKSSWIDIKDSYEIYAAKVELLCQLATPPPRLALPPASDDTKGKEVDRNSGLSKASRKGQGLKKQHH